MIQCILLLNHRIGSHVILISSPRRHSSKITAMDVRFEKMNYDRKNRTVKTLEVHMVYARSAREYASGNAFLPTHQTLVEH